MRPTRFPIIVSGMIAGDPYQGGAAWAVLQYVLGLQQLGHDVYLIESLCAGSLVPAGGPLAWLGKAPYFRSGAGGVLLGKHQTPPLLDTGGKGRLASPEF